MPATIDAMVIVSCRSTVKTSVNRGTAVVQRDRRVRSGRHRQRAGVKRGRCRDRVPLPSGIVISEVCHQLDDFISRRAPSNVS
jgi:hypothetical protein